MSHQRQDAYTKFFKEVGRRIRAICESRLPSKPRRKDKMTKTERYARDSSRNVLAILALIFVGFGYYRLKEYRFSPRVIWYAVEYGAELLTPYPPPLPLTRNLP